MKFLSQEEIENLQIAEANSDKKPKKTAEQIQAIYSSGQNILVSASAGSGKTFVMAERILDQLARGVEIRQLFISTFTVKAATGKENQSTNPRDSRFGIEKTPRQTIS